jgi:alkylhydroperoxidase family enzyme
LGKRRGVTDEQIAALKEPGGRRRDDLFTHEEQAVLRFTELLTSRPGDIDESDLDDLGRHFSMEQIIELGPCRRHGELDEPGERWTPNSPRGRTAVGV